MKGKRNIDLEQEMSDDRDTYDPADVVPPPAMEPAALPAPPLALNHDLILALAHAIRTGTVDAINQTKPVQRERESECPSVYHPEGTAAPRPELTCTTFWGVIDEADQARPPAALYEMEPQQLTDAEIRALNTIEAGAYRVKMYGGSNRGEPLQVYLKRDYHGHVQGKILGLPKHCYAKDMRNNVPGPVDLAASIIRVA